jgi:dipeptidyl aminopeptidase/acylaminoacyl peptidase
MGIIQGEKNETFVVSIEGGEAEEVLSEEEAQRFFWSPDGRALLYLKKGKLMAVPVEGGEPREYIEGLEISVGRPVWSPDGKRFVSLVADKTLKDPELEPPKPGMSTVARPFMDLYLVSVSDGRAENLTTSFEDNVSDPVWSGEAVYFKATDNRTYDEAVYRYSLKDERLTVLAEGEESYGRLSVGAGKMALTLQDATHPEDLWVIDVGSGLKKRLTELNPQLGKFRFSKPELFYYYNADGEKLGALLYKPVDFKEGDKVPVITNVYEKLTPGIHRFNARSQMFLNHGYAMLQPNVKVKVGETATSFVECVVPAVNTVRAMGFTNGKFAIWGGSFGGYSTSYLITQTDIFACAVSRATPPELFRNWASGRDRDSYNIVRGQARMAANPYEARERYIDQSAFFHLDKVNTPVMIMHGIEDYTILYGEGEMMFYALRQLGKEAVLVLYTYGDHSLIRGSRSDALDVYYRMLEWFKKYLKREEAPDS